MNRALFTLKKYWGYDSFLKNQNEIINSILEGNDTISLIPTGGGKSMCFQIPAIISDGTCIVISPLIALITDQVNRLKSINIDAEGLHSGLKYSRQKEIITKLTDNKLKLLYISPEKLQSKSFRKVLKDINISFLAVDEAHCISQWGYDFRPEYRKIHNIKELFPDISMAAFTATANKKSLNDIQKYLSIQSPSIIRGSFLKDNLSFGVIKTENKIKVLTLLLKEFKGSGIIYMRSRRGTELLNQILHKANISSDYYHAGMSNSERNSAQNDWLNDKTRVILSTTAFGMGIDKPNVRFVLHYDLPTSMEEYYQEAGRAGRDRKHSDAIIIYNEKDINNLIKSNIDTFPSISEIHQTYSNLKQYSNISVIPLDGISSSIDIDNFFTFNKLEKLTSYKCINELERYGIISLNIPIKDKNSSLRININIDEFNLMKKTDLEAFKVLQTCVNIYENIFISQVRISENSISSYLKIDSSKVSKVLKELNGLNIVTYQHQARKFTITFNHLPIMQINKSELKFRFKRIKNNIKSIINYLNETKCRQKNILKYFDEKLNNNCGLCDNCLDVTNRKYSNKEFEKFTKYVENYDFSGNTSILDLIYIDTYLNRNKNLEMIKVLINKKTVKIIGDKIIKPKYEN